MEVAFVSHNAGLTSKSDVNNMHTYRSFGLETLEDAVDALVLLLKTGNLLGLAHLRGVEQGSTDTPSYQDTTYFNSSASTL